MRPTNIQTPEQLFALANIVHEVLMQKVMLDDTTLIQERGHVIATYMANTGKMLADARYHRDEAMKGSILKQVGAKLPASTLNELVKAECKDDNYLVNWIEQLDKECKYQLDWLRSCLSTAKEELRMQGGFTGNPSNTQPNFRAA
jgi:hypothetical protein